MLVHRSKCRGSVRSGRLRPFATPLFVFFLSIGNIEADEPAVQFEYGSTNDNQAQVDCFTKHLADHPKDVDALVARGLAYYAVRDYQRGDTDLAKAIELEPTKLSHRIDRAIAYFEREEYDRGFADVLEAMRLNPGDVGVDYQPNSDKELSREALRHGEEQVRRMLKDRPAMAEHVNPGDKLWTWAVRKFAGEDLGSLINWDPGSPALGSSVSPPFGIHHAHMKVALRRPKEENYAPREFHDLWSSAVFELYNAMSFREFARIEEQAQSGQLTRDQYVLALLNAEELAAQRSRAFYIKFLVPWLKSQHLPLGSPYYWGCTKFHTAGDPRMR